MQVTPFERVPGTGLFLKRDDLFTVAGVRGGKVRTCWGLAQGATGLVTASSRHSPQAIIVASIARELGIPARLHMPSGPSTPEMLDVVRAGGVIEPHRPGHNSVIIHRAKADAEATGFRYIPFGMECQEAVNATAHQAGATLPYLREAGVTRVVVPVGSAMSLAGILHGLGGQLPVLGVMVGAPPRKRLDRWAPLFWEIQVKLVNAGVPYHHRVEATLGGVVLDPVYEAKCVPFLQPGDCLWLVGCR